MWTWHHFKSAYNDATLITGPIESTNVVIDRAL